MRLRVALIASLGLSSLALTHVHAEPQQFCVKCVDPDQTYVCQVNTTQPVARADGLQLYCIVRTSKEGGHRSCAVDSTPLANCAGQLKSYTFAAPAAPSGTQATIEQDRQNYTSDPEATEAPGAAEDRPATVVGASKRGIQSTGPGGRRGGARHGQGRGQSRQRHKEDRERRGRGHEKSI